MGTVPVVSSITGYKDFVITARRKDPNTVIVTVDASPIGRMETAEEVSFSLKESEDLRKSFFLKLFDAGGASLSRADAANFGNRLAKVLFPGKVFQLFSESLAAVLGLSDKGLRIRLAMDETLIDLPWEYVCRPDRQVNGISDFLMLDPSVSIVRCAADNKIRIEPITGSQRLVFVGTLWKDKTDHWEVRKEFDLLRQALKPVSRYIRPEYTVAGDAGSLTVSNLAGAALFQYSGHCAINEFGRAYLIREMPDFTNEISGDDVFYLAELAFSLTGGNTRLAVMNACNSGYWAVVKPLLDAGIPAVIGVNGSIFSDSATDFCAKLYESLAVGLTLDEAVDRARMYLLELGRERERFDWGLFMVYMPSPEAVLFPRSATPAVTRRQQSIRLDYAEKISNSRQMARELDDMNYGEIMSELAKRRVLILGRFTDRRLQVLEGMKTHLKEHTNHYIPELFTYDKPEPRDLIESIIGFAALSRFIIADLSEPKSIPSELEAVVPHFPSIPVVPVITRTEKEYATFSSIKRRENVIKPTIHYSDLSDLIQQLDEQGIPLAERKLAEGIVVPGGG